MVATLTQWGNTSATQQLVDVQTDVIQTNTLWPAIGQQLTDLQTLTWPEDRYLIGWQPWIGFNKDCVQEGHVVLYSVKEQIFLKGPHKEIPAMYDITQAEFFPYPYGVFVKKGDPIQLYFLTSNTGSPKGSEAATANARIYSVKA